MEKKGNGRKVYPKHEDRRGNTCRRREAGATVAPLKQEAAVPLGSSEELAIAGSSQEMNIPEESRKNNETNAICSFCFIL